MPLVDSRCSLKQIVATHMHYSSRFFSQDGWILAKSVFLRQFLRTKINKTETESGAAEIRLIFRARKASHIMTRVNAN